MVALVTITTPSAPGKPEKLDLTVRMEKVIPNRGAVWLFDLDNRFSRERDRQGIPRLFISETKRRGSLDHLDSVVADPTYFYPCGQKLA